MNRFNLPKTFVCLIAVYAVCFTTLLHGQETDPAFAHIDSETSVLVRIDAAALDALIKSTKSNDKASKQTELQRRLKQTRKILSGDPIWLTVGFPQLPLSTNVIIRDPDGERIKALQELWDFLEPNQYRHRPPVLVVNSLSKPSSQQKSIAASRMQRWKQLMATSTDTQEGQSAIQFACLPPAHLYDTYSELLTELPAYLGGGSITLLTDGMLSVSGTMDVETGLLNAKIDSASPVAATSAAQWATQLLGLLPAIETERIKQNPVFPIYRHLKTSTFKSKEQQVLWQIPANNAWQPGKDLQLALGATFNRSATKRLRDLALGVLNYESAKGHLPPPANARDPKKNRLSWRVHILPYFGDSELYNKFALDEPWDSPTNIKLLPEMPSIYSDYGSKLLAPSDAKRGYTTVVAPSSERTILGAPRKVTFGSITDGTSNTILLVVVKDNLAVPWTAPQDYVFDPKDLAAGLKFTDGKTPIALCDCSTMQLVQDNDWEALFEMNDGKPVRPKE